VDEMEGGAVGRSDGMIAYKVELERFWRNVERAQAKMMMMVGEPFVPDDATVDRLH
jgi:hypothetical protein